MSDAKTGKTMAAIDWDERKRQAYEAAEAKVAEEDIADVPPLTDSQKEELRAMGRTGCLALPISGMTLDAAPLGERLWRYNWRVWMELGFAPQSRFIDTRIADAGGKP